MRNGAYSLRELFEVSGMIYTCATMKNNATWVLGCNHCRMQGVVFRSP